jgi:ribosomal protein S18 acetylase RimI-like enzyme
MRLISRFSSNFKVPTFMFFMDLHDNVVHCFLNGSFFFGASDFGHVDDIVVDAGYRGKGYGLRLMQRLIMDGQRHGYGEIIVDLSV